MLSTLHIPCTEVVLKFSRNCISDVHLLICCFLVLHLFWGHVINFVRMCEWREDA